MAASRFSYVHSAALTAEEAQTIVDYTREPFVCTPGNVRVTFDYYIRTGLSCTDFLDPGCVTIPAGDAPILLEDSFLERACGRDTGELYKPDSMSFGGGMSPPERFRKH